MSGKSSFRQPPGEAVMLNIAREFSAFPAGRYENDGPHSGARFLREVLMPKLSEAILESRKLVVDLDGLKVCGSSFLESAFGGVVRSGKFPKHQIIETIEVAFSFPELDRYARSIKKHLDQAKPGEPS